MKNRKKECSTIFNFLQSEYLTAQSIDWMEESTHVADDVLFSREYLDFTLNDVRTQLQNFKSYLSDVLIRCGFKRRTKATSAECSITVCSLRLRALSIRKCSSSYLFFTPVSF